MDVPQSPAPGDVVTASELVRRFGWWRERALVSPVYVLHRGKPRLVLASVELIERLCRTHQPEGDEDRRLTALLDGSPDMIVIAHPTGAIVAASRSVRARFGDDAAPGAPVAALVAADAAAALLQSIGRVAEFALAETVELTLAGEPARPVTLAIAPHPDGVALFGRDAAHAVEDRDSFDQTFAMSSGAAVARIDEHGFLDGPHTTLSALTGVPGPMLSSMRLVSLFALPARAEVAAVIAAVATDGTPRAVSAPLLTQDEPRQVTASFAPRRRGDWIRGVVALIVASAQADDS
ncbi:hypothetical protein [Sphingomonas sp.]|jgi:PAS domain-containing protein|uniref:hypothetical protein n=1 Tax=Sphingomonas sp. TaxID=28214 RepID=UPI002E32076C|nr:hypothetical protein [Sphingomonas sp.]HEX4693986.1 hypothetical protein [Sphingomonas sp.]